MSNRLQRSMALMDAKADVKIIKERANVNWYDTKMLANAVYLILEELTATNTADTPQTDLVKESPSLVKDLVNAFCEDGTWLERQGVYTLTLAEAKQRAVDIIEAVSRKDDADTPQTDCDKCIWNVCNYNKVEWDADTPQTDCGWGEPNE